MQGDGQRPKVQPNFGDIAVFGSDRRVEGITEKNVVDGRERNRAMRVI